MNNIILTAFENRYLLNNFNFLAFIKMKTTMPEIDRHNMHIAYHGFYKYIQYHVLLRHVPVWLPCLLLLIAIKQD